VGDERLVPLRYEYSTLDSVDRAPTTEYDAIRIRVLADDPDTVPDQVETWQDVNDGRDGGEHILIAIDVPETTLDRIRNVIGMGQVLEAETESHDELEREQRTDKRRLESSVSDLLKNAAVHTVHDYRGERPSVLEDVVEDQVQAVFGSTRKVLSRPLVEVDDAKGLAKFFRGSGDWPLADSDAVMLGVDTSSTEIADTGWCRAFIDTYESQTAVDVETLLQQTRTANGDYRGTPQESIAALLITLATSNEKVALKQDTDYVTDPTAIGRHVRTKGGLTSLQVRFGVDTVNPKEIRKVVSTVLGHDPDGSDPDAWVAELASWVENNSVLVKRTFKGVSREFDVSLTRWRAYWNRRTAAVTPPHRSWWRTASSPKRRRSQMHANSLLSTGSEGALGTVHRYPRSAGGTLPQCDHYLTDADDRGEWIRTDKDDSELTAGGCDWTPRRRTHVAVPSGDRREV